MRKMSEKKSVKKIKSKEGNEKKQSEKNINSAMKRQNLNTEKSDSSGKNGKKASEKNEIVGIKKQYLKSNGSCKVTFTLPKEAAPVAQVAAIEKKQSEKNMNLAMKRKNLNTEKSGSSGKKASGKNEIVGIKKQYLKSNVSCKVTFTLPKEATPQAQVVTIVGDFNNWNLTETQMKKLKSGDFQVTLKLPRDREYRFRYLVDSTYWKNDWCADKYVPNSFGCDDSLVIV
ncbi:MAG: isoamylase early set domain-containing protein [Candidatus Hodarchaeales archaeon]|jgi:hypothetical protein